MTERILYCPECGNATWFNEGDTGRCAGSIFMGNEHEPCAMEVRQLAVKHDVYGCQISGGDWQARCSCGWHGRVFRKPGGADRERAQHLAHVNPDGKTA